MAVLTKNSTVFSRVCLFFCRNLPPFQALETTLQHHFTVSLQSPLPSSPTMRPPPKAKPQDSYIRGHGISPSTSDNGDLRGISFSDIPGKFKDLPVKDSVSDILEPFAQTIFGTSSKIPRSTPFEFPKPIVEKSFVLNKRKSNLSKIPLPQSAATFYNAFSPQFEIMESCESTVRLNLYLKARKDDVSAGIPGKFLHAVSDSAPFFNTQEDSCRDLAYRDLSLGTNAIT
ncbi:hypothetical protein OIU85_022110 [Salix viminalis]|uniref:Uncharacterized protein n=1 Tax=Salix viminalis TaxID=40686 RepID=A0A9Q0U639_SALVM|nr:hypothetical protein OIU85_022110 [Salix viminalis]